MSGITSYQILRSINVLLGGVSIGFEAYAYENSYGQHKIVELTFLSLMGFFTAESILSLLIFGKKPRIVLEVIWRLLCSVGLIVISSFLIYHATHIHNNLFTPGIGCKHINSFPIHIPIPDDLKCQWYELKLAAGIIAIANGVIYLLITCFQTSKNKQLKNSQAFVYPGPGGSKIIMHPPTPYPQASQHQDYRPTQTPMPMPVFSPPSRSHTPILEEIPVQQIVPRVHLNRTNQLIFNYQTGQYDYQRSASMSPSPIPNVAPGIRRQVSILSQKAAAGVQRQASQLSQQGRARVNYHY